MTIELVNIAKKFGREWIFKNVNYTFQKNNFYAITGLNGTGKSTLLQTISGFLLCSNGVVILKKNDQEIAGEKHHEQISMVAPYIELIEEMTTIEFLNFHSKFKPFNNQISLEKILEIIGLSNAANKQIRNFSSGMKQRLKLAQAFFSNSSVLLLDEPCSNLDTEGVELYNKLIAEFTKDKIVIICSNDIKEYNFCNHTINIQDYK